MTDVAPETGSETLSEIPDDAAPAPHDAIASLLAENAALKEQVLRVAADAENAKRRAEKEANDARAYAIQRFARDLFDPADNLSRALQATPKAGDEAAIKNFVLGVEMTEKALQSAFERNGLKRIAPERGARFDPNFHQAMMEQPADDVAPGSVVGVMQSGYELFGRVVRPAMVMVSPKAQASTQPPGGGDGYARETDGSGASVDRRA